jgi:hypothetical protein
MLLRLFAYSFRKYQRSDLVPCLGWARLARQRLERLADLGKRLLGQTRIRQYWPLVWTRPTALPEAKVGCHAEAFWLGTAAITLISSFSA